MSTTYTTKTGDTLTSIAAAYGTAPSTLAAWNPQLRPIAGQVLTLSSAVIIPPVTTYLFADEFDGAAGSPIDSTKWAFDLGGPGAFGNNELETYTNSTDNCYQDGASHLVIKALNPSMGVYTSARVTTNGKFATYGHTWEASIKLDIQAGSKLSTPVGGTWPAWWFMGPGGWPKYGEIDMVEVFGNGTWEPASTVWTPSASGTEMNEANQQGAFSVDSGWHTWRMAVAEPGNGDITFSKDGVVYFTATPGAGWIYSSGNPLYTILNLAVGGSGGGTPNPLLFPVEMLVDYVHCF